MGLQVSHAIGSRQRLYVEQEAVPAAGVLPTFVKATATGAVRVLESTIEPKYDRQPRRDAHGGRQDTTRHDGKRSASWKIRKYLMGSGAATTPPDDQYLHQAFWGTETIGGSSVTYSLSSSQQLRTFSLSRLCNYDDAIVMDALLGCLTDEWKLVISGNDFPVLEFGGPAYDFRYTGYGVIGTGVTSATQTLGSGEGDGFEGGASFGSIVQAGANTNTGAGYRINSIASDAITLESSIAASNGDIVRPYAPSPTTAGVPIAHTLGSLTVARSGLSAQTFKIKSAEVSAKNNVQALLDHAFEGTATDMKLGMRELMLKMVIRARRDFIVWLGRRRRFVANNIIITMGDTAGARGIFTAPQAEFEVGGMNLPAAGDQAEGEIELNAVALDTETSGDGNNDAATFVYS